MKILAIETSCDETAAALVEAGGGLRAPRFKVLKNIVSSQIKIHRPFGGVVPNLAKREHIKNLPKILKHFKHRTSDIKLIAVTVGPGLEPALWTGIEFANGLAKKLNKPLIGANHMEGHLYSNWLPGGRGARNIKFPAIALVVSGGHTILLRMSSLTKWKKLGETRDDAAGEAFDKVARLLGLPYPGGPEIQKIAAKGNPKAINFPRPMLRDKNLAKSLRDHGTSYDFSFSGLKTAVLYYLRDKFPATNNESVTNKRITNSYIRKFEKDSLFVDKIADIAASFQQAVIDTLVGKTIRAAREYGAKSVLLCGGVSANKALREQLEHLTSNFQLAFHVPDFKFNTDNAAMIAAAAYIQHLRKKKLKIEAQSNLNL
ncbi:MAG: tRNA (adenosine(37)-N6)-threonylcarbamoyltransferase complex transferase subunit TsaD [Patescibacteria group bacterium]